MAYRTCIIDTSADAFTGSCISHGECMIHKHQNGKDEDGRMQPYCIQLEIQDLRPDKLVFSKALYRKSIWKIKEVAKPSPIPKR